MCFYADFFIFIHVYNKAHFSLFVNPLLQRFNGEIDIFTLQLYNFYDY